MKITLVNPPVDFRKSLGKIKKIASETVMIPLGLAYVAGMAKRRGFDVAFIDAYAENLSLDETIKRIRQSGPQIVGISSVTPTVPSMLYIAQQLKNGASDIVIVAGGAHPTVFPEKILASEAIDIVVRREGEDTFADLAETLLKEGSLKGIKGISYKDKNGVIIHNEDRPYIPDLDRLPFPAYDSLRMDLYSAPPHWLVAKPAYQMLASRGCPFNCTFCGIKALGRAVRHRSIGNIITEMDFLHHKYNCREVMFVDATFPINKKIGMEFCNELIVSGLHKKIKWVTETRVDIVDYELLKHMHKAGCRVVGYGLESGSEKMLKRIKKNASLDRAREAVKISKKAGLDVYASFIMGLPGETMEDMRHTVDFIKSMDIDYPKINLLVPYPGSELYDEIIKLKPDLSKDWDRFTSFSSMTEDEPVYVPDGITPENLKAMHKMSYREIYLRPRFILKHIRKLNSWTNIRKYLVAFSAFMEGIF